MKMIKPEYHGRKATSVQRKTALQGQDGYKRILSQQTEEIHQFLFMTPAASVPRRWSSLLLALACLWALTIRMTLWMLTCLIAMISLRIVVVVATVLEVNPLEWQRVVEGPTHDLSVGDTHVSEGTVCWSSRDLLALTTHESATGKTRQRGVEGGREATDPWLLRF